jgi:hypothetical protein
MSDKIDVVLDSTKSYIFFDDLIELVSDDTDYGLNTVAFYKGQRFYLGDEEPTIVSAIHVYETANDCNLSEEQMSQITKDNYLISCPI